MTVVQSGEKVTKKTFTGHIWLDIITLAWQDTVYYSFIILFISSSIIVVLFFFSFFFLTFVTYIVRFIELFAYHDS